MKRTLFILLTLAMLAIGVSAYAQNSFTGKVTYSYTADKVPSRIYILMVPKDKATGYTEDDVYGAFGTVYNTRGEKTVELLPKEETPTGEYTLLVMLNGEKTTYDIEWLTEEDRALQDTVKAINDAIYQELYKVIEDNIELMPDDFSLTEYEKLHEDYRVKVMKAIASDYTFKTIREFAVAFDEEVEEAKKEQKKKLSDKKGNSSSSGGSGGGGGGGSYVSMPAVPIKVDPVEVPKTPQSTIEFQDLDGFEWAKDAIYALSGKKIVSGTGEGEFQPQRKVTRAEFSTMLVKLTNAMDENATVEFEDVEKGQWYYPYVASAKSKGYINGRNESIFAPNDSITRYEAVIMVYNTLNACGYEFKNEQGSDFGDISELSEAIAEIIKKVSAEGIVVGKEESKFCPFDSTTRAEAAVIINRLTEYIK